jgi:hypothetical protein
MYRMCRLDSFRGAISESINVASSSSFRLVRSMDTMNMIKCYHWMSKVHDIDMGMSIETIGRLLAILSPANSRNGGNPTLSSNELGLDDEVLITDCLLKSISSMLSRA